MLKFGYVAMLTFTVVGSFWLEIVLKIRVLKRIKRALPDFEIIAAYSDNKDDDVLLKIAKNGYWVDKKGRLVPFLQK